MRSLAISYRRADVAGFWIVGSALVWLMIGLIATGLGVRAPWAWGLAAAAALALPAVVWRPWLETGVWVWNGSVRKAAAILRFGLLAACYYILLPLVGLPGSTFAPRGENSSASSWRLRRRSASGPDDI